MDYPLALRLNNRIKAYKFTNLEYYKKGTFRLGTLYDYRSEEEHVDSVADTKEGSFDRKYLSHFETTDEILRTMTQKQKKGPGSIILSPFTGFN